MLNESQVQRDNSFLNKDTKISNIAMYSAITNWKNLEDKSDTRFLEELIDEINKVTITDLKSKFDSKRSWNFRLPLSIRNKIQKEISNLRYMYNGNIVRSFNSRLNGFGLIRNVSYKRVGNKMRGDIEDFGLINRIYENEDAIVIKYNENDNTLAYMDLYFEEEYLFSIYFHFSIIRLDSFESLGLEVTIDTNKVSIMNTDPIRFIKSLFAK
jgi:hypothetical protein